MNAALIYNNTLAKSKNQPPDWDVNFDLELRTQHVWDGVVILCLLEEYSNQNKLLRVVHNGDADDRFRPAMQERNARMECDGQPEWSHYCEKCVRIFPATAETPPSMCLF